MYFLYIMHIQLRSPMFFAYLCNYIPNWSLRFPKDQLPHVFQHFPFEFFQRKIGCYHSTMYMYIIFNITIQFSQLDGKCPFLLQ